MLIKIDSPFFKFNSPIKLILACLFVMTGLTSCADESANTALGTLERDRVTLSATAAELITAIPVKEGVFVSEGQLLVQLDDNLQRSLVLKAQADVLQYQAVLDKLISGAREEEIAAARARVVSAKALLEETEREYQRSLIMVEEQLIAQAKVDETQSQRDSQEAMLEDADEQLLQLLNGTREEDLRQAEAVLQAAQAILQREEQNLNNLSIVATRDGILNSLPWNVGERVFIGSPLAILLADAAPFARVYIPEQFRAQMSIGETLSISIDGVENSFQGTVRWLSIEPAFTPYYALNSEERSRLMYLAEIQLPESASSLPSGLPVEVLLP